MAVDPYALCPCGSGKKLKFCCSDLAGEIEKIHHMIQGDQPRAALQHVNQTLAKRPGRESLLDLKVMLELSLDQLEDAAQTIETFIAAAPKNPSAHAQKAVLVSARDGGRAAVLPLQQALALIERNIPQRVLEAIGSVGQALLMEGNILAARAHLWLYQGISGQDDTRALQFLVRINQTAGLPLPLRDHLYLREAPAGHPGEADHNRAQYYASRGQWLPAAQAFDSLCGLFPDQPGFAYNRGLIYGWLGDVQRFVTGMHEFARGEVPEEEAIEAEAIAQLLDPTQKDPPIDVVRLTYPITDEEALLDRLASDRRVAPYEIDPEEWSSNEGPPPRAMYLLLDKPLPTSGADIQRDQVPSVVGFLSQFGRQTDRPERLELVLDKNDAYDAHLATLGEVAGQTLGEPEPEVRVGESNAAEQALSWRWHFPVDTPPAHRRALLTEQRRESILSRWPNTPRTALQGKTPREAAGDAELRIPLAAAVQILEQSTQNQRHAEAFLQLREELNLPVPDSIDPANADLEQLPLGRATRLKLAEVSDDDLVSLYRRAAIAGAPSVVAYLAGEAVRRPSIHDRLPPAEAYQRLISYEDDTPKALSLVAEARAASDAAGESNAIWDLLELELQIVEGNPEQANRLLAHLRDEHINEPGVAEELYQLLYALGATPDNLQGPAPQPHAAGHPEPRPAAVGENPAGAPQGEAAPSKIWTPGDEAGEGGKKLWTPG